MLNKRRIYEFDDFRVDTGQFLLTRNGRTEPITPTVFRILHVLLERAGEVVTKEELMEHVWPDSHVEEGNLNRNVSTLRKALGEKPSDHRYIETVPKTGYRLIAPVRVTEYQPPAGFARKAGAAASSNGSGAQIVGREFERKMLQSAYARAREGFGSLTCISGEVGVGKTALLDAFLEDLNAEGSSFHVARSRCTEAFAVSELFIPWIEGFGALAQQPAAREVMEKSAPNWYREITHDAASDQRRLKRELVDLCSGLSSVHPLIIVLDDFQWSDDGSVDLLAYLGTRLEYMPVMVVLSYRLPDMKVRNHPFMRVRSDLLSRGACREIHLSPLTRPDVDEYLSKQKPPSDSPNDAALLYSKSDGNPLFLRELATGRNPMPDSIRHIIDSKLGRVDDTHRQLLVTASVQGREFDSAVLAATMKMDFQDVEEALQYLDETHAFVHRMREEELPDGKFTVRYRFVYSLYQEACYASLAPTRKAALSSALAETFLAYYSN